MATSTTSKSPNIGSLKTDLESFKAEVQAGLGNLERNFDKLARELKDLAEHSRRPINWGWIIGAAGLVMSVTTAIVRLGATGYIDTLGRHESALLNSHAADLVRAREDGREDEAFRQLEVRTTGWERKHIRIHTPRRTSTYQWATVPEVAARCCSCSWFKAHQTTT